MKQNQVLLKVGFGTLIMLLLGIVYSYSIFRIQIEDVLQVSTVSSGLPYMLNLFFYSIFMAIGGILLSRYSTLHIGLLGIVSIALGFYISSIATTITFISLGYGILVGTGVGLLYGIPLRVISQMNHPKTGLLMGITLLGFGLSTMIFAPVINELLATQGLHTTFIILAFVFVIVLTPIVVYYVRFDTAPKIKEARSYPVLKQKQFYLLYTLFFISTFIGLTFIGFTGNVGKELIHLDATMIAVFMGLFAIFNGVGRPLYGFINDKIGFRKAAMMSYSLIIIMTLLHYLIFDSVVIFIISFIVFYISFGGWLSLVPSTTIKLFGKEDYSKNYGIMFTAYGLGAIVGNVSGGVLVDTLGLRSIFLLMTCISTIGLFIVYSQFNDNPDS